ncbi:hypothetical protein CQW23_21273 [Capsicum baccatum]|uniref:Uncharacterized protein n=1 Tax=Capsicum baccatum TaxID=33114 RepID=A0A2G2VXJ4_CAPBA|nr:hypothetical protein CQW23_21273 [Capsicum baccatum]
MLTLMAYILLAYFSLEDFLSNVRNLERNLKKVEAKIVALKISLLKKVNKGSNIVIMDSSEAATVIKKLCLKEFALEEILQILHMEELILNLMDIKELFDSEWSSEIQIYLKFRTAFVSKKTPIFGKGELVKDERKIAFHYMKNDFGIALIAALPLPQLTVLNLMELSEFCTVSELTVSDSPKV